jgi:cell division septation protein DedD
MADELRLTEEERIVEHLERPPERGGRRGRRLMTALIAIAAVLGFGVVLVYAYKMGQQDGSPAAPPIIKAQEGPEKVRPETPGGMKVPDRDKEIFSRLESREQPDRVERLLPPPDKPMDRPEPSAVQEIQTAAGMAEKMPEKMAAEAPKMAETAAPKMAAMPEKPVETMPAPSAPEPPKTVTAPTPAPAAPAQTAAAAPKPAPAPAPAPAKKVASAPATAPAIPGWRVQLSSLKSQAAAEQSWKTIQQKNRDVLGKLSLNVQTVTLSGGRGTYYRVQAGPFASRNAASAACTTLKARKQGCLVVRP